MLSLEKKCHRQPLFNNAESRNNAFANPRKSSTAVSGNSKRPLAFVRNNGIIFYLNRILENGLAGMVVSVSDARLDVRGIDSQLLVCLI